MTNTCLGRQNFCSNKIMLVTTKLLSRQKCYLWRPPPMIADSLCFQVMGSTVYVQSYSLLVLHPTATLPHHPPPPLTLQKLLSFPRPPPSHPWFWGVYTPPPTCLMGLDDTDLLFHRNAVFSPVMDFTVSTVHFVPLPPSFPPFLPSPSLLFHKRHLNSHFL